jgi:glycosyltransferase involved in cell wall biosynthesis
MKSSQGRRTRRKILVLGSQSFLTDGAKVGIQIIAEGIAQRGHHVHYVSSPSSPVDALSPPRQERFQRGWIERKDRIPAYIQDNLYEYILRVPFPINRRLWLTPFPVRMYPVFLPRLLKETAFDLCLHDASPTHLFLQSVRADRAVFRLNDKPEGFSYHVPTDVTERLLERLRTNNYDEVWSVSTALNEYVQSVGYSNPVVSFPNGVDLGRFGAMISRRRIPKTAVFIGAIERWVDLALIMGAARLLPDWQFDLYGPCSNPRSLSALNVRYRGVLPFSEVPDTLARYSVGLIPFRDGELIRVMDKPLKFFEYLAAGLGVASTDVGRLKDGMGEWSTYGTNPESFASAILAAAKVTDAREKERRNFLAEYSWTAIIDRMLARLERLW